MCPWRGGRAPGDPTGQRGGPDGGARKDSPNAEAQGRRPTEAHARVSKLKRPIGLTSGSSSRALCGPRHTGPRAVWSSAPLGALCQCGVRPSLVPWVSGEQTPSTGPRFPSPAHVATLGPDTEAIQTGTPGPSDLEQRLGREPGSQAATTSQPRRLVTWGERTLEEGQGGLVSTHWPGPVLLRPKDAAGKARPRARTRRLPRGGRGEVRAETCFQVRGQKAEDGTSMSQQVRPQLSSRSPAHLVRPPATRQCRAGEGAERGVTGRCGPC